MLTLYGTTLSQFLFPEYLKPVWMRLVCLAALIAISFLISSTERLLIKYGVSGRYLIILAWIRIFFCGIFFLFMLSIGTMQAMDFMWLLLTFFLYFVALIIGIIRLDR